jgi:hypothetical protein
MAVEATTHSNVGSTFGCSSLRKLRRPGMHSPMSRVESTHRWSSTSGPAGSARQAGPISAASGNCVGLQPHPLPVQGASDPPDEAPNPPTAERTDTLDRNGCKIRVELPTVIRLRSPLAHFDRKPHGICQRLLPDFRLATLCVSLPGHTRPAASPAHSIHPKARAKPEARAEAAVPDPRSARKLEPKLKPELKPPFPTLDQPESSKLKPKPELKPPFPTLDRHESSKPKAKARAGRPPPLPSLDQP